MKLLGGPEASALAPTSHEVRLLPLLGVAAQLALVLLVVQRYQLESRTFFNVLALTFAGFTVHALLPLHHRLSFFAALSMAAVLVAFGWFDGLGLLMLGLLLIGICHLPLGLSLRVIVLLATAGVFALWRAHVLPEIWSNAIWPILGSMFMFRIALYLHALKHDEKAPTPARTLSYFFMIPNVSFPLFPVVDYLTFRRTYFDRDAIDIYATGIKWIVRGLVHLLLYRLVYLHFTGDALDVRSLGDLVQFLLATFLLYLRVSGQFHLICGILHLFGFRLPETHHLYYLSSSFTDFWRRINIYWKDFMMKLVYYPSFFRLKRFGATTALVGATIIVFLGTWLLHSYQWFWLRGGFPLEPQDGLFWGVLGALVVFGALGEMRRSRPRRLGVVKPHWSWALAWRTVCTFAAICILWSLWSAESLASWLVMWSAAGTSSAAELVTLGALLALGLAIAGWPWSISDTGRAAGSSRSVWQSVAPALTLLAVVAIGFPSSYAPVAPRLSSWVSSLQHSTLNARDAALQHKGYYENLDNASRLSAQLWVVGAQKPAHWGTLNASGAYRVRDDFLGGELRESVHVTYLDQRLSTNAWGMRDLERQLEKPPGVFRIAVLGPSHVMGSGVADADTFTRLLEKELNGSARNGPRFEVLNFGVAAYALTQQLAAFESKVVRFKPDVVVFTDSPRLGPPVVQHMLRSIAQRYDHSYVGLKSLAARTGVQHLGDAGAPVPFDGLRAMLAEVGIRTRMPWAEADQRLRRSSDDLIRTTLEELSSSARRHGAVPVFLALDNVVEAPIEPLPAIEHALRAGMVVFDLLDLWQGRAGPALRIAPWDNHPNAAGNRIVAERIRTLFVQHAPKLGLMSAMPPR